MSFYPAPQEIRCNNQIACTVNLMLQEKSRCSG